MHRHCQEHVRGLRQQPLLLGVSNKHVVEQGNESTKTKVCEQSSSLVKDKPVLLQRLSSHQHLREVQAAPINSHIPFPEIQVGKESPRYGSGEPGMALGRSGTLLRGGQGMRQPPCCSDLHPHHPCYISRQEGGGYAGFWQHSSQITTL